MANETEKRASLSPGAKYLAGENFILRKVAGTYALISIGANIANFNGYIQLNETAAFLWQQMKSPKTLDELVTALTAEFEVSAEEARADVEELLEQLVQEEMVTMDG